MLQCSLDGQVKRSCWNSVRKQLRRFKNPLDYPMGLNGTHFSRLWQRKAHQLRICFVAHSVVRWGNTKTAIDILNCISRSGLRSTFDPERT